MTVVQIKKAKITKRCFIKRQLKFGNYKKYLEANQLEIKINHLEKNKIDTDHIKENHKEFIKNIYKSKLKTLQKFKSEMDNVFTEEINKTDLNSNGDKRMQSIDSIKTYTLGTSKGLVSEKEEIKCSNIIKRYNK